MTGYACYCPLSEDEWADLGLAATDALPTGATPASVTCAAWLRRPRLVLQPHFYRQSGRLRPRGGGRAHLAIMVRYTSVHLAWRSTP